MGMHSVLILVALFGAATVPHQATLYYQSTACTNSAPCQLLVYRTVCPTPTTCPNYGNGHGWIRLIAGDVSATPTLTGTTWIVVDKDPALQDNTTYAYTALLAWQSSPSQVSSSGPVWSGTTSSGGTTNVPQVPTVGSNNSVH